ncbi:MAG: glucosaminidase domain-containing protein [Chitinophagales bacterium]|jgi:flagellum-specific peptidoglycan hydrolase FlgJ
MASFNQPYSTWANAYPPHQPPRLDPTSTKKEAFLFKLAIILGLAYLVWDKKISITLAVAEPSQKAWTEQLSLLGSLFQHPTAQHQRSEAEQLRFLDYTDRFAPVAKAEMRKFGIPASVSLAHALLISQGGNSLAAQQACNPFHLKCQQDNCEQDHCLPLESGEKVLQFATAWSGYRAFSKHLANSPAFQPLLHQQNLSEWALRLQQHFQPQDPAYADALLDLINQLQLRKYDQEEEVAN